MRSGSRATSSWAGSPRSSSFGPRAHSRSPERKKRRKRFEREARATSGLRSPHTIAIYDFGFTDRRTFYYAMELLEGFSLDVLVEKFGELPPPRAIHLLRGACESLTEAHERGLIHRDIKPANIFTCAMGMARDFVKVLDFGLVKQVMTDGSTSLTAEGAIPGSPAFLPPEAAKGDMTAKADVYALGCVAYWLLTANYVFNGVTALEMMVGHVHMQPKPLSERTHQKIPEDLEKLVLDCLKKEPTERPTMKEVGDRLAACAATSSVVSKRRRNVVGSPPRGSRHQTSRRFGRPDLDRCRAKRTGERDRRSPSAPFRPEPPRCRRARSPARARQTRRAIPLRSMR